MPSLRQSTSSQGTRSAPSGNADRGSCPGAGGTVGQSGARRRATLKHVCSAPKPNALGAATAGRGSAVCTHAGVHTCTDGGSVKPRTRERNFVHLKATLKPEERMQPKLQPPAPRTALGGNDWSGRRKQTESLGTAKIFDTPREGTRSTGQEKARSACTCAADIRPPRPCAPRCL